MWTMDSFNSTILHVIEVESFLVKVVISCKFKTDDTICHFVHVAGGQWQWWPPPAILLTVYFYFYFYLQSKSQRYEI